jgi:hypothetical protein
MSKYTKGPWITHNNGNIFYGVISTDRNNPEYAPDCENSHAICQTYGKDQIANAKLIAAAPELLEACISADLIYAEYLKICPDPNTEAFNIVTKTVQKIRLAIKKAEGN